MILTITLILSFLVVLNFFLLKYSCNKTSKETQNKPPHVMSNVNESATEVSNQLPVTPLAATGS